jgi:hypothetical protein
MRWPTLKCPSCGGTIPNTQFAAGRPLTCPSCSQQLRISGWYMNLSNLTALGLSLGVGFIIGYKGLWLAVVAGLLWFPINIAWNFLFVRLIPPRFEVYVPKPKRSDSGSDLFPR